MKLTFPHLGNAFISVKVLLDEFKVDYVIPPFNNKKALEIGIKHSPEFACLPLKINIGNIIEACNKGADTVLMAGGCGPCRFGYYGQMEKEILKDAGYDLKFVNLDFPRTRDLIGYLKTMGKITNGFNIFKIYKAIRNTAKMSLMVDELERLTYKIRPREVKKGSVDSAYKNFLAEARETKGFSNLKRLVEKTKKKINEIEINKEYIPLKVGIVGEIYTTIDSNTSFNLDARLGSLGVEVDRKVTISNWIIEHMLKKYLPVSRDMSYAEAAKPYLGAMIGGHAQETIGNSVQYAKDGYDGIIQIYPLTCMPEIVAQSILPKVENDFNIPVLTLIIDEMTGEAGYLTRVEAFTDLLARRKEMSQINGKGLLPGY
jgi:predicted nucleotide-binding protein (sugar kinase/HSP70/actin superfamily)